MRIRDIIKTILSILLLFAGLSGLVMIYFITRSRMAAVGNSETFMWIADGLILIYSFIYIICALKAMTNRSPRRVVSVRPFLQVGAIMAAVQIIISASNGIFIHHLLICLGAGIIYPEIFFLLISLIMARR